MITAEQVRRFSRLFKINDSTVFREYLQIIFLNNLYKQKNSSKIFFKGGTAIHLLFKAPRFSEDLDFSVELPQKDFVKLVNGVFAELGREEGVSFKERETVTGKRYLLTAKTKVLPYATFINLDFSFREKVVQPEKSVFDTPYPVIFTSFIYHLSKDEIFAEKVRALLTRQKGRDLYDLWFLLSKGASLDDKIVREKLSYYKISDEGKEKLLLRVGEFPEGEFISDLRPFIPINERDKLGEIFAYTKEYLLRKLREK